MFQYHLSMTNQRNFNVNDKDILLGRGTAAQSHPGNQFFRDLITSNKLAYVNANPPEKKNIIRELAEHLESEGHRFMKRDVGGLSSWSQISYEDSKKKIGQALRENAPEILKKPKDAPDVTNNSPKKRKLNEDDDSRLQETTSRNQPPLKKRVSFMTTNSDTSRSSSPAVPPLPTIPFGMQQDYDDNSSFLSNSSQDGGFSSNNSRNMMMISQQQKLLSSILQNALLTIHQRRQHQENINTMASKNILSIVNKVQDLDEKQKQLQRLQEVIHREQNQLTLRLSDLMQKL